VGGVVTKAGAFVGWVDTAWAGPGTPVHRLEDAMHVPPEFADSLAETIDRVRALREAALRSCRYCGARHTPGYMHTEDVCQGCAPRHLGVVY
jgi:hypothetical protein